MDIALSGNIVIDIFILAFILIIPIPSTPFLIYLISTSSVSEFAITYFFASNIYIVSVYSMGRFSNKVWASDYMLPLKRLLKEDNLSKLKKFKSNAYELAINKLKNISPWSIIVLRAIGIHPTIIAFGSGMIVASLLNNLIANLFFVTIDVLFYWALIGSGKLIIQKLFPNIDFEIIMNDYLMQTITASIIIIYVTYFLVLIFKKRKNGSK